LSDPARGAIRVLFEDERVVAVDKDAGVATAAGSGIGAGESLQEQVAAHIGGRAFLVHRLDRETSGVIVFAKTAEAHRALSRQFEERLVSKRYLALVSGHVDGRAGEVSQPLREFGSGRVAVDPKGREALTRWELRERLPAADLLEVEPMTGRRHQIRVHLYATGHPVIGDTRYGEVPPVGGAHRLMLHALELRLARSEPEEQLVIRADPPAAFMQVVEAFRAGELPWTSSSH
jgi:RluA family pseudouridine synthase